MEIAQMQIQISKPMKCLEVQFNRNVNTTARIRQVTKKTAFTLNKVMPNVGGAESSKKKVFSPGSLGLFQKKILTGGELW